MVKASIIATAFDALDSSMHCEVPLQIFRAWRRVSRLHPVFPTYGFNGGILKKRYLSLLIQTSTGLKYPLFLTFSLVIVISDAFGFTP